MRKSYRSQWLIGLLAIGSLASACSSNDQPAGTKQELPTLDFLWIPKELKNEVFETGRYAATTKTQQLTALGDYKVNLLYSGTDTASDVEGQAALLRQAVDRGAAGVAISCNNAAGLKPAIDTVTAAGIPVMTFDSDSPESSRFTYLGIDNQQGGALGAKVLGKVMRDTTRTKVALVSGVAGATNLEARITGFKTALAANYPNLEIIDTVYCDDDGDKAAPLIENLIAKNADLGGLFFVGLWPLFVCEGTDCSAQLPSWDAAAKAGTIKTVVFDTLPFELDFVRAGMVSGLIGQKYWGWGFDAIQMLYDHVVSNKEFSAWTDSGIDVVCPNNVEEMASNWRIIDFTAPLTPCAFDGVTLQ